MKPILAMLNLGGSEIILILMVLVVMALVFGASVVAVVLILKALKKSTPAPPPQIPIARKCPQCGAPLKTDAPEGLCPACLMQRGIATEGGVPPAQTAFVPPSVAELATLFPQLEILGVIGKGGMGAVYKARQPALDRFVALKILAPPQSGSEVDFASRFTREARALAKLNHPNIVGVYDFGAVVRQAGNLSPSESPAEKSEAGNASVSSTRSLNYFLMEFVDGPNLRQVEQAGKLSPREALQIIPQICAALQFAHDEGIVHRDIKPENVMLDKKGRVKIADFGLAKILGQEPQDLRLTGAKDVMGTPHYMAPEQVEKPQEVDHRADIYSLGVVFYEMLTGELPLGKFQPPSQKVQVDVRLDEVVLRALAKEPERRYQQASQVKTDVETIATTMGSAAASTAPVDASSTGTAGKAFEEASNAAREARALPEARFSRTAIAGAAWIPFVFAAGFFFAFEPGRAFPLWFNFFATVLPWLCFAGIFGTTTLGWVAVSQIRRSAGRLHGLWLAVFDGLLFPLIVLDGLITLLVFLAGRFMAPRALDFFMDTLQLGFRRPGMGPVFVLLAIIAFVAVLILVDIVLLRAVWRAADKPTAGAGTSAPLASSRVVWAGGLVAAVAILGFIAATHFSARSGNNDITSLVNQPYKLRSLPNATVIQVGLADPKSGWAWQELKNRAQDGRLLNHEGNEIVDGLTAWMHREYPEGYDQPLFWMGELLNELNQDRLVGETNILAFLKAYYGNPSIEPLPRIRENESTLRLTCDWRSLWLDQHSLGFELLNEMRSITVDGRQVLAGTAFGVNWKDPQYSGTLKLPSLAPGKHLVRCEVDSAIVAARYMVGLANSASSVDWPPAQRRWTRICEAELMVYAEDAEIVRLSDDPALNPVANGALSCNQIIIRRDSGHLKATVAFNVDSEPERPIGIDVTLRLAGQTIRCGKLFAVTTVIRDATRSVGNGSELTVDIAPLDPEIKETEILLTPNPKAVEEYQSVDRIWGKEIIVPHVPLSRQDLYSAQPETPNPMRAQMMSFGTVMERILPDFAAITLASGRVEALPESVRERNGVDGNKDAAYAWMKREGLDMVSFGDEGLVGLEMTMHTLKPDDWENDDADRLTESLIASSTSAHDILQPRFLKNATNYTCAFKTREGDMGILQITGFTDNPRSVKLRYKLVEEDRKFIAHAGEEEIELLAVSSSPVTNSPGNWRMQSVTNPTWWRPDGTPTNIAIHAEPAVIPPTSGDVQQCQILFRVGSGRPGLLPRVSFARQLFQPTVKPPVFTPRFPPGASSFAPSSASVLLPASETTTEVSISVATGPWQRDCALDGFQSGALVESNILCGGLLWNVAVQLQQTTNGVRLTGHYPLHWSDGWDHQLAVLAGDGHAYLRTTDQSVLKNGAIEYLELDQMFENLRIEDIHEIRFRIRPYQTVTFRKVSLRSGYKTQVETLDAPPRP